MQGCESNNYYSGELQVWRGSVVNDGMESKDLLIALTRDSTTVEGYSSGNEISDYERMLMGRMTQTV